MTTTPLPSLPKTPYLLYYQWPDDEYGFNGSEVVDCDAYTADQMQAYATQARADLEAENQRLREALQEAAVHIAARWGDSDPHAIKAFTALEKQP